MASATMFPERRERHVEDAFELARTEMKQAIDAVCDELGIPAGARSRRAAVAEGVAEAYRLGRRQPLYLVDAGLDAAR